MPRLKQIISSCYVDGVRFQIWASLNSGVRAQICCSTSCFIEEKIELQIMYKRGHQRSLIFSLHSFPWIHPHQHFAYIFHFQSPWFNQTSLALPLPESFYYAPTSFRHQEQRCPPAPAVSRCLKAHL